MAILGASISKYRSILRLWSFSTETCGLGGWLCLPNSLSTLQDRDTDVLRSTPLLPFSHVPGYVRVSVLFFSRAGERSFVGFCFFTLSSILLLSTAWCPVVAESVKQLHSL